MRRDKAEVDRPRPIDSVVTTEIRVWLWRAARVVHFVWLPVLFAVVWASSVVLAGIPQALLPGVALIALAFAPLFTMFFTGRRLAAELHAEGDSPADNAVSPGLGANRRGQLTPLQRRLLGLNAIGGAAAVVPFAAVSAFLLNSLPGESLPARLTNIGFLSPVLAFVVVPTVLLTWRAQGDLRDVLGGTVISSEGTFREHFHQTYGFYIGTVHLLSSGRLQHALIDGAAYRVYRGRHSHVLVGIERLAERAEAPGLWPWVEPSSALLTPSHATETVTSAGSLWPEVPEVACPQSVRALLTGHGEVRVVHPPMSLAGQAFSFVILVTVLAPMVLAAGAVVGIFGAVALGAALLGDDWVTGGLWLAAIAVPATFAQAASGMLGVSWGSAVRRTCLALLAYAVCIGIGAIAASVDSSDDKRAVITVAGSLAWAATSLVGAIGTTTRLAWPMRPQTGRGGYWRDATRLAGFPLVRGAPIAAVDLATVVRNPLLDDLGPKNGLLPLGVVLEDERGHALVVDARVMAGRAGRAILSLEAGVQPRWRVPPTHARADRPPAPRRHRRFHRA